MKVIGRTGNGILVEATDDELSRVSGVAYTSSVDKTLTHREGVSGYSDGWRAFNVGAEIQVSPMWDWMKTAREQFEKITKMATLLHGVAEILANAPPPALVESEESSA